MTYRSTVRLGLLMLRTVAGLIALTLFASQLACVPVKPPAAPPIGPVAHDHEEAITVRDGLGQVIAAAHATLTPDDGSGMLLAIPTNAGRLAFLIGKEAQPAWGAWLHVWAETYAPVDVRVYVHLDNGELLAGCGCDPEITLLAATKPRAVAEQQAPLPPMPPGSFDRDVAAIWPNGPPPPSQRYLRADLWGVTIPGLPFVPGGSSRHPERALTWFLDRWAPEWQDRILEAHAKRGYTHFYLSWPDSRDGAGQSLEQFIATATRVKQAGFYVGVFLGSKVYDPKDMTVAQYASRIGPALDALLAADVIDECVPAWEMDLWNIPGRPTIDIIKFVAGKCHAAGKHVYLHFSTEKTSWFANGDSRGRFGFYQDLRGDVDGLNYQADVRWTIQEAQARLVDTLRYGVAFPDIRAFETSAEAEFDNDHPDERDAALRDWLLILTKSQVPVWGFGNGGWQPDGRPW